MTPRAPRRFLVALACLLVIWPIAARAQSFVNFETGQVRPLALSPDGTRLFAVNTPDNRLEVFDVDAGDLTHVGSVEVGLEPIAVASRSATEAWVVNHLSDTVSIVDLASPPARVVRTLTTCDEPRDILFAGPGNGRAFITTARRGQDCPVPSDLTTEGLGRAVVQVFDANDPGAGFGGTPIANVVLFGDTPRALARSADGSTVYAAVFHSGNQTTSVGEFLVCDGGATAPPCSLSGASVPGGLPAPNTNFEGKPGPEVGLVVKFNQTTSKWEDELGRDWSSAVRFSLPDLDVFAINAAAALPVETASFPHVGTILFNMVVNPVSGRVYVSNTDAKNEVRFEGDGLAFGSTTVQGHLHEARISVIDGGVVQPHHLNKHIDYEVRPADPGVKEASLATPVEMAVTADGATLYVAAFGSSKVGKFSTAELESDTFVPDADDQIDVSGGGPTGLVLDEANDRMYVFTRFDNSISVIDLAMESEIAHLPVYDPEPADLSAGRRFLYDADFTSSNGEASCSSCHVFGDFDSLAWDLGNPDDVVVNNPLPFRIAALGIPKDFHPLKGPMTTQSLRGMANHGSMHWRGDRTGGNDPGGSSFDEDAAFKKFNPAFVGLIGREEEISAADMQAFTDFILSVTYPPNPIRKLDNTLSTQEQEGRDLYFGRITDVLFNCNGCHTLDPNAEFFGSDGFGTFEGESQMFKVAHLRNAYQKVGMFGIPGSPNLGPQVRGFGYLHDGAVDTVRNFLGASVFDLTNTEQSRLERFVLAFDSNMAPIVGKQVTLGAGVGGDNRADLLLARAAAGECEVVIRGVLNGEMRGGLYGLDGNVQLDRAEEAPIAESALRPLAETPGQELTYMCVPPGSGERIALDRDEDGAYDRDELDDGTDPSDPLSLIVETSIRTRTLTLRDHPDPTRRRFTFASSTQSGQESGVVTPAWGSDGDPTAAGGTGGGARLTIYRADGSVPAQVLTLDPSLWKRTGSEANPGYHYTDKTNAAGPITSIRLRRDRLTVSGKGSGVYALADAPQGAMVVRLRLGLGAEMCASAQAQAPAAKNDTTTKFVGVKGAPPPAVCPFLPVP